MLNVIRDILPLTDFKRKTSDCLDRLRATGRPLVLTINGKAEIVVLDAASYQAIQERLLRFEQDALRPSSRRERGQ